MSVMRHWYRMSREAVVALSLETFKVRSEEALSNLFWLKTSLLIAGGLG